jgi:hypothetical protein
MRGADYSIPVGTAFSLSGIGSDPDTEDVLTLREQNDSEDMQTPLQPSPVLAGPLFRSRAGT